MTTLDLGAKINAADKKLGSLPGEIVIAGGGVVTTPIRLSPGHHLRLGPGLYDLQPAWPILLGDGCSVRGCGWGTVLLEPAADDAWTAIAAVGAVGGNEGSASELTLEDFCIRGRPGKPLWSVAQTVALGNVRRARVSRVYLDGTHTIGLQLGGNSTGGFHAEDCWVTDCLFRNVAAANLAVTNGRSIHLRGNTFRDFGQPGSPPVGIDVEPNAPGDWASCITIEGNLFDLEGAAEHGGAIVVQSGGADLANLGPIRVCGNTIVGGSIVPGQTTNRIAGGILAAGLVDLLISGNIIRRTAQQAISLYTCRRALVSGNLMADPSGGGNPGMELQDSRECVVCMNVLQSASGATWSGEIRESGSSDGNTFRSNCGASYTLVGAGSTHD